MNHRGEVFKQSKPTLAQQILNIQPPRTVPENIPIFSSGDDDLQPSSRRSRDDDLQPTHVKRKNLNATVPASSSQAPMDVSSNPKRNEPETNRLELRTSTSCFGRMHYLSEILMFAWVALHEWQESDKSVHYERIILYIGSGPVPCILHNWPVKVLFKVFVISSTFSCTDYHELWKPMDKKIA